MEPYAFNGTLPAVDLAWMLFANSGEPGMYLLYRELRGDRDQERTIFD